MIRCLASLLVAVSLLAGCGASTNPTPTGSQMQTIDGTPAAPQATATTSIAPSPSAPPAASTATIPVRRSALKVGTGILMAPAPDGGLYVSIPAKRGSVLLLLDPVGQVRPGWPQALEHSTACNFLATAADGSVRAICDATDLPPASELEGPDVRAFAYDADGRAMTGWPIEFRPAVAARVVGDVLTVLDSHPLTDDLVVPGQPSHELEVTTIGADGVPHDGVRVPISDVGCGAYSTIGPDGVAYIVDTFASWCDDNQDIADSSTVLAIGTDGTPNGWPETLMGSASPAAYGPDGRIVLTVGSTAQATSRVAVVDPATHAVAGTSAKLPMATAEGGVDCNAGDPETPLVSDDGTIFVTSEIDPRIFALDADLKVLPGWPYTPSAPIVSPGINESDGIQCQFPQRPAVGPDGTLYLPLQTTSRRRGGSLVAVGRDGRVVEGWPVTPQKSGSAFWSVVVGPDGTTYALAVEPESGDRSSATILGVAPESTVRYRTTVVDQ